MELVEPTGLEGPAAQAEMVGQVGLVGLVVGLVGLVVGRVGLEWVVVQELWEWDSALCPRKSWTIYEAQLPDIGRCSVSLTANDPRAVLPSRTQLGKASRGSLLCWSRVAF